MNSKTPILKLRYNRYIAEITSKRINGLIPIAVLLLILLFFSDIFIRHNIPAAYTRIIPLGIAVYLFLYHKIRPKSSNYKVVVYNIFLASIPAMMFAKYIIHYGTETNIINIISIIVAYYIIATEVRANIFYSILIHIIPPIIFGFVLYYYLPLSYQEFLSLINILIVMTVSFVINQIQNNFRYKNFLSNHLLNIEKSKLEEALYALERYKDKLEEKVTEKTIDLKYALDKARESDMLKTQFLLNISHELRTPMNAVLGFSEISSKKNPKLKKEADLIQHNLNLLLNTIENIMLLSKLQTEKAELEISTFKLSELNSKINDLVVKKLEICKKDIIFEFDNQIDKDIIFNSDLIKITEIFNQLIDNAVKYTEKGKIKLLCSSTDEKTIKYIISDTGIGINKYELPNIFDSFRKHENKNKLFGGTGIGLSIVKKLSELIKANIEINSIPQKGTNVIIIIQTKI